MQKRHLVIGAAALLVVVLASLILFGSGVLEPPVSGRVVRGAADDPYCLNNFTSDVMTNEDKDKIGSVIEECADAECDLDITVIFSDGGDREGFIANISSASIDVKKKYSLTNSFAANVVWPGDVLCPLASNPDVIAVEYDWTLSAFLASSVPMMNADDLHAGPAGGAGVTGDGTKVCIIDTGVNVDHSALSGSVVAEKCSCEGCCPGGGDTSDSAADDGGHGSHVAGIVASSDSTNRGVAPDADIYAFKALDEDGNAGQSDIVSGLEWCESQSTQVIVMSLGTETRYPSNCDGEWRLMKDTVGAAIGSKGLVVFAASGNEGDDSGIASPSCVSNIVAVAATDRSGGIASYSNRNSLVEVAAPGGDSSEDLIYSTGMTGNEWASKYGTSMAAPHAAGAAALLISADASPSEALAKLKNNGASIGKSYPRVDTLQAYSSLKGIDVSGPDVSLDDNETTNGNASALGEDGDKEGEDGADGDKNVTNGNVTNGNGDENVTNGDEEEEEGGLGWKFWLIVGIIIIVNLLAALMIYAVYKRRHQ